MCNFMGYKVSRAHFIKLKEIEKEFGTLAALEKARSGFIYSNWDVIVPTAGKKDWDVTSMHWEFIPNWVQNMEELERIRRGLDPKTGERKIDPKTGKPAPVIPWLNAKAENLLTSNMWRDAALNRRCLVIASWFFEARHIFPIGKRTGQPLKTPVRYPYKIFLPGSEYFLMAGIWNPWTDRTSGEMLNTFAIVTTKANSIMEQIHNTKKRMPTILPQKLAERWIFDDLSEKEILEIAGYQLPSSVMAYHSIPKDYLDTANIEEYKYEEVPDIVAA